MILGVDGCKKGWITVQLDENGFLTGAWSAESLEELIPNPSKLTVVGIDMPLYLLDAPERPADQQARCALGAQRGRSVFSALPSFTISKEWLEKDFNEVNEECRLRYGRAFSRQSLHLRNKIAEVNHFASSGNPLIEVHPELSFATMNGMKPLEYSKKTWGGIQERLSLLKREGIILDEKNTSSVGSIPADDVLDAASAAWSALRFTRGQAVSLPEKISSDKQPAIWT